MLGTPTLTNGAHEVLAEHDAGHPQRAQEPDRLLQLPDVDHRHPAGLPERRRLPRTSRPPRPRGRWSSTRTAPSRPRPAARSAAPTSPQVAPTCGAPTTYNVPSNGAIYSNETVIIGGTGTSASTVNGRVTVTSNNDIVIGNNITYQAGHELGARPRRAQRHDRRLLGAEQPDLVGGDDRHDRPVDGHVRRVRLRVRHARDDDLQRLDRDEPGRLDVDVRHPRLQLRPEPALAAAAVVPDASTSRTPCCCSASSSADAAKAQRRRSR